MTGGWRPHSRGRRGAVREKRQREVGITPVASRAHMRTSACPPGEFRRFCGHQPLWRRAAAGETSPMSSSLGFRLVRSSSGVTNRSQSNPTDFRLRFTESARFWPMSGWSIDAQFDQFLPVSVNVAFGVFAALVLLAYLGRCALLSVVLLPHRNAWTPTSGRLRCPASLLFLFLLLLSCCCSCCCFSPKRRVGSRRLA